VTLGLAGCGSGDTAADLSSPIEDLLAPPDMVAPAPSDMARARCSLPAPLAYTEVVTYSWTTPPNATASFSSVGVGGDGVFIRNTAPIASPDRFVCSFTEVDIDPETCTAPCCPPTPRQPQPLAPMVYVDARGWSSWTSGSCAYFVGSTPYTAAVLNISTQPAH
jgi:hypothetical protein